MLVTDTSGAFHAVSLVPGLYTIEADVEEFRRKVTQGVKVDIAKETSLPPIQLELGPLTETVVVQGGVSQVQTTNAELSSTVTMEQIEHLPLIGRDPLNLIHLESGQEERLSVLHEFIVEISFAMIVTVGTTSG